MTWRPSRGTKLYQQECIDEGDEEDECPGRGYDQYQTGCETESGRSFSTSYGRPNKGKLRTTGPTQTVQYSPDDDQPCKLVGAGGYQGGGMCPPKDTSRGERYQPFEVCPDYQSVQYSPNDEPLQCSRGNARPMSPRQKSCPERNEYSSRSFRGQGAEYMAECDERPPTRAVSPQFSPDQCRQPMSPQNRQFVDDISSPYGTRFQSPSTNTPMNASTRSFRQQRGEDALECEEGTLPRGQFNPDQYRVSMSPQNRQFVDDISSPYGTRFQSPSTNTPMNASTRSFRQQRGEDALECEEGTLPRGQFNPDQYRVSMSPQNRQFVDDISSPCGTRFQNPSDNTPMNASTRSFRQQRGEDALECEERPPARAVSPQFSPDPCRQPMTPQNRQFVDDVSSPCGTRFQVPCDMNATSSSAPPIRDSTIYHEIAPLPRRDQSGSRGSPLTPDSLECQHFSPDALEDQCFSPDSLEQQNFSPDSLEPRNFSPDCPEAQNFSPDCPEPRNTSGSPGARISPDYLDVPQNSPSVKHCYPHRTALRTPGSPRTPLRTPETARTPLRTPETPRTPLRTPEQYGGEDCGSGGSTFRKPGPEYLTLGNSGPYVTPSPAASSASSYGKFNLSSPSQRSGRGASPPITCVGGSPKDNKREALENLAQLTKSGKRCPGGSPKDNKREALENLAQLTVTKPGKPCPGGSPKGGVANFSQATVTKPGRPCFGGSPKGGVANFSQATVTKPGKPCPGGSPKGGVANFSQGTVTKPGKPCPGVTPQGGNREALDHLSQLTVTRPGKPCIAGTPQGGNSLAPCNTGTVTKSVPPRCKRTLDFGQAVDLSACDQSGSAPRRLPKKPELSQDEIKELIDSESEDVEYAWLLSSEKKQTYKKPCPKQQKAQMSVKQMVEAAQKPKGDPCGKEYPPLLEPDPEDLSPEVAAAMMFSQEQGIKLDSCPDQTIRHLFPSESLTKKPPPSKISIVDPNQKDQEELIEKSAYVPSEGVSDSAYTRTMKQKGGDEIPSQKSYDLDFALGQEKREVVLVPQRPKRFNTVQFRGNVTPWFPGYFSAFPDQSDSITIVPSPSKLFLKAWIMTNPANVQASDIIVID